MNGKEKCKILKEIRRQIAAENDIQLTIAECTHKGDCRGTCPRCEAEVRYLEEALEKRRMNNRRVALAGLSVGVTLALTGCTAVESLVENVRSLGQPTPKPVIEDLMGVIPYETATPEPEPIELDGEVGPMEYPEDDIEDGEIPEFEDLAQSEES